MGSVTRDPVIETLRGVHNRLVDAGIARTAGDDRALLDLLEEVRVELTDLLADLRRAAAAKEPTSR